MTTKVLILGAGNIGVYIAQVLTDSGDYQVTLTEEPHRKHTTVRIKNVEYVTLNVKVNFKLKQILLLTDVVISALPYYLNLQVAKIALECSVHYFDLTEYADTARKIRDLAKGAKTVCAPQCGLAPGFISIVAYNLVKEFNQVEDVNLRVGALPQFPNNILKYNLTWSTEGLINEYCNSCEAIYQGNEYAVLPLGGLEHFSLDGIDYEAFNTSGGIGTLCDTLKGRVRNLNYKTVRYPGHRDMIRMLSQDLKLNERREIFKDLFEFGIPTTKQDVVLIFVAVTGRTKNSKTLVQKSYVKKIYGNGYSNAIQTTTAAGVCAMVDLHREGKLVSSGFIRQEDTDFNDFINNRFGKVYA